MSNPARPVLPGQAKSVRRWCNGLRRFASRDLASLGATWAFVRDAPHAFAQSSVHLDIKMSRNMSVIRSTIVSHALHHGFGGVLSNAHGD